MKKIFISTTTFGEFSPEPIDLLKKSGFLIKLNPHGRSLLKKEIVPLVSGAEGLIAGTEALDRETLSKLPALKVISRCGVGLDNIDLKTAKDLGIKIFNTQNGPNLAVAELTVGLILSLLRKIPLMDREMRADSWKKRMGTLLCGKEVGIIGLGNIGRRVAELLKGLGAQVSYCDPKIQKGQASFFSKVSLKELIENSDIISLHVPYTKKNHNLLCQKQLSLMKRGSFLVNTSRGGLIDEKALYSLLKKGRIAGAALDVFKEEPYRGRLKDLDNCILTPHIGSYAREIRIEMEIESAKNLIRGF